jgi:hypothetical protein
MHDEHDRESGNIIVYLFIMCVGMAVVSTGLITVI